MVKKRIKEITVAIKTFFMDSRLKIDKVVIFGSHANGRVGRDSDVDIAIVSRDFEGKDVFQKATMLNGLEWYLVGKFKLPFDILPLSLLEWKKSSSFAVEFAKEGLELSL